MIRDLLNKKKWVKIHTLGGGGDLDKFGSFSHFFSHLYLCGEGVHTHLKVEKSWIFQY